MSSSASPLDTTEASVATVYVGPTSPKLGLVQYHHYLGFNEQITQAIQDNPALNILLIPLDDFVSISADIYAGTNASVNHAVLHLTQAGVL
jgi:hypothetical protein